jgi:cytosol alanyl aminopeptidase
MNRVPPRLTCLLAAALAACAAAAPGRTPERLPPPAPSEVSWIGDQRLPDSVRPLRYRLDMTVAARREVTGTVSIDVQIMEPTRVLRLHAREVSVLSAVVRARGFATEPAISVVSKDALELVLPEPVRGAATIELRFVARVNDRAKGVFLRTAGEDVLVYTQFEPVWARRAFPCFDEPRFKTPWRLTLRIPPDQEAISNTPILSDRLEGGLRVVDFAETRRLPTYLVAFAVGRFEWVDAGRTRDGIPMRVAVPRGSRDAAARVAAIVRPLVAELEDYTAIRFPFAKLDLVGIPSFHGGMENAGIITLDLGALAGDGPNVTHLVAHELAHQWFGDLVTAGWWDDIWLHEAFATWLSDELTLRRFPDRRFDLVEREWFDRYGLPVDRVEFSDDDVTFRSAYGRGAQLLRMIEAWIGPAEFRGAVRRFLKRHAFGTVTRKDLAGELADEPRRVFLQGLRSAGQRVLEMRLHCPKDKPATIEVRGARSDRVPVCIRYGIGAGESQMCAVVTGASQQVRLGACPDWVAPNRDGLGTYAVIDRGGNLPKLVGDPARLHASERRRVLWDLIYYSAYLPAVKLGDSLPFAGELVAMGSTEADDLMAAAWIEWIDLYIPNDLRARYRSFLRRSLGSSLARIVWTDLCEGCPDVAKIIAQATEDPSLVSEAKRRWDESMRSPSDRGERFAAIAVRDGDQRAFDLVAAELSNPEVNQLAIALALGSFREASLVRQALDLAERPQLPLHLREQILKGVAETPESRALAVDYLLARPVLLERFAASKPVINLFGAICDRQELDRTIGALRDATRARLEESLERAKHCIELRAFHEASLRAFLATVPP